MGKFTSENKNAIQGKLGPIEQIRFTVYGDPVPKARPRVTRYGTYTPERTEAQEARVAMVYKSLYHGFKFERGIPLRLVADFYMPIPKGTSKAKRQEMIAGEIRHTKRPDADNLTKLIMDSSNGVIFADDSQVVEITSRKFYSDTPRTEIFVARIGHEE